VSKRRPGIPGTYSARQRRHGVHFNELAARRGWKLEQEERVVAALALDAAELGPQRDPSAPAVIVKRVGTRWEVWYPDERNLATPIPVYDQHGARKGTVWAAGPGDKTHVRSNFQATPGVTDEQALAEAIEHARALGAGEVRVIGADQPPR
jgi:hypothetical protein